MVVGIGEEQSAGCVQGWTMKEAMDFVVERRSAASPNAGFAAALSDLEEDLHGCRTVKVGSAAATHAQSGHSGACLLPLVFGVSHQRMYAGSCAQQRTVISALHHLGLLTPPMFLPSLEKICYATEQPSILIPGRDQLR